MRQIFLAVFPLFLISYFLFLTPVFSLSELDKIEQQIKELNHSLQISLDATRPLESSLNQLEAQILNIQNQLTIISQNLALKKKELNEADKDLDKKLAILAQKVRSFYKRSLTLNPILEFLLSSGSINQKLREFAYQDSVTSHDKQTIAQIALFTKELEQKKEALQNEEIRLNQIKKDVDAKASFLKKEISKAKAYQQKLSIEIAGLSARQQALLSEKTEIFQTSVGEVPLADDPNSSVEAFRNSAPGNSFTVFSFGAPHFKGMSQYGAYARSKEGQSAETILKTYYGDGVELKKDYSTDINISIADYGTVDLETYVKRIYEMPSSWGDQGGFEALKAQAVAARSYALAYTNNGAGSICATESCQVYKPVNKGGKWEEAANATRGWVIIVNGKPFPAWYASTSGGYQKSYSFNGHSTPSFWDTKNGRNGWTSQAFEKLANSPWFYKAWYKSRSGNSCGRSNPWLSMEEFTDIVNALIIAQNDSSALIHLSQTEGQCLTASIPDTWDKERVKNEADRFGGRVNRIDALSINYSSDGTTASVVFQTDKGEKTSSGIDFKTIFNLRAPAVIHLKSNLFNIEKK